MRLLVDMNLSPKWVEFLSAVGLDAVHWSTVGPGNASDTEIMAFAKDRDCVVLTHDLDFSAILAATQGTKPSVIQIRCTGDLSPEAIGLHVANAIKLIAEDLATGALVTVDTHRSRLRVLPLKSAHQRA